MNESVKESDWNCFEKTSGMAGSLYGKADAGVCSHSGGPGLAS